MSKKKHVTRKDFERKIKVWTVATPLIVAVITSLTTIGVTYLNRPGTEYRMSQEDRLEVNKLSAQIDLLAAKYFEAEGQEEKGRLDAELRVLAEAEAAIMRKYNPDYRPRWPVTTLQGRVRLRPAVLIPAALILLVGLSAHYALRRVWEERYRRQLSGYIIEVVRRAPSYRGVHTAEVIHRVLDEHDDYRPEEIERALRLLRAEQKLGEDHNGRWVLPAEDAS